MQDEIVQQTPLRDTLNEQFEAAEAGTLQSPEERARDEAGRFKPKEAPVAEVAAPAVEAPALQRPSSWKKDYLPMWDKLATGAPLTPEEAKKLAEYTNQRETEYKTGVSTYRAEAQQAKELQEAVTPFLAELQANNTTPANWIREVGAAHLTLTRGSPEQKLALFHQLAQRYGVPLGAVQQPGLAPILAQLMQPIGDLRNQVQALTQSAQQKEVAAIQSEVEKMAADTKNYPHFDAAREKMAQLLEKGLAPDVPQAYAMAVRLDDGLYEQEVNRLASEKAPKGKPASVARAQAVSPKSATPSGQVATTGAKDRRSVLAEQMDAMGGGRV